MSRQYLKKHTSYIPKNCEKNTHLIYLYLHDTILSSAKQTKAVLLRDHIKQKEEVNIFTNLLRSNLHTVFSVNSIILDSFIKDFVDNDNWLDICLPNYKKMFLSNSIKKIISDKELKDICMRVNFELLTNSEDIKILSELKELENIIISAKEISNVVNVINDRAASVLSEINKELLKVKEN